MEYGHFIQFYGQWEDKEDGLPMLFDIKISCENNKVLTSNCRKPMFGGVFKNFERFIPDRYKSGLIGTLLHSSFILCSN